MCNSTEESRLIISRLHQKEKEFNEDLSVSFSTFFSIFLCFFLFFVAIDRTNGCYLGFKKNEDTVKMDRQRKEIECVVWLAWMIIDGEKKRPSQREENACSVDRLTIRFYIKIYAFWFYEALFFFRSNALKKIFSFFFFLWQKEFRHVMTDVWWWNIDREQTSSLIF